MANRFISLRQLAGAVACTATLFIFSTAHSKEESARLLDAEKFVMETSEKAITILKGEDNGQSKLRALFRSNFDYELMGRYAMGRYWERANSSQQAEYNELFAAYVPNGYVDQLKAYNDAAISLVGSKPLGEEDSVVTTKLAPKKGDAMVFDWRVRAGDNNQKVIDLVVGGVSYLKTLREQFTAIAARKGVDGLLELLRKHAGAKAADAGSELQMLAGKLRTTPAIAPSSKLALKLKIDALVQDLGRHHDGERNFGIVELKSRFDALVRHTVALLRSEDPALAAELASLRRPLWWSLSDPAQFTELAVH